MPYVRARVESERAAWELATELGLEPVTVLWHLQGWFRSRFHPTSQAHTFHSPEVGG